MAWDKTVMTPFQLQFYHGKQKELKEKVAKDQAKITGDIAFEEGKKVVVKKVKALYKTPQLYHYRCWGSGMVLIRDEWGNEPTYQCQSYDGDFNCGCRKCPWGIGLIVGQLELQDYEKHQNNFIDSFLKELEGEK